MEIWKPEINISSDQKQRCPFLKTWEANLDTFLLNELMVHSGPGSFKNKKEGIDQKLIQSSTTPDPGHHMEK